MCVCMCLVCGFVYPRNCVHVFLHALQDSRVLGFIETAMTSKSAILQFKKTNLYGVTHSDLTLH